MIPRSRDPLVLAMEQLAQALASANERALKAAPPVPAAPLTPADTALLEAVTKGDIAAIAAAVAAGADVNTGTGRPLQLAAQRGDENVMKELVILGAEVTTAVRGLQAMQGVLATRKASVLQRAKDPEVREALQDMMEALVPRGSRYRVSDQDITQLLTELDRQGGGIFSSQDQAQYKTNQAAMEKLQAWERHFIQAIAPLETLRMQRKIMDTLAEMKQEITQKPLDKPRLAAPKKPDPAQPQ